MKNDRQKISLLRMIIIMIIACLTGPILINLIYLGNDIYGNITGWTKPTLKCHWDEEVDKLAADIVKDCTTDEEKVVALGKWITKNLNFDYPKAEMGTIEGLTTYGISFAVPDINETLNTKSGVCRDIAPVFVAMLRSQGIPAALVTGGKLGERHMWCEIKVGSTWRSVDISSLTCTHLPYINLDNKVANGKLPMNISSKGIFRF